jgi:hypothetical protein
VLSIIINALQRSTKTARFGSNTLAARMIAVGDVAVGDQPAQEGGGTCRPAIGGVPFACFFILRALISSCAY